MLVWKDVSNTNKKRRPEWLDADADFSCMPSVDGHLWTPTYYAPLLALRDVEWVNVGDNWQCAQYDTFQPKWYLRDLKCSLWIDVLDVDGTAWQVPALLRPDGLPAIGMKNRAVMTENGLEWERFAPSERLARALECAQAMRPHCEEDFETLEDPNTLMDTMLAVLESAYNLNAGTIACMGLMGDVILHQGCKFACAVVQGD